MRGKHLLLHWARTQQVVSMSSAEAELHALCKCASELLGAAIMTREFGEHKELRVHTDSSAAKGIVQREGAGKVKHLDVKCLWVQERETCGDLSVIKIPRAENCSDYLTHHSTEREGITHLSRMGVQRHPAMEV